jgi:hypothetical protein
MGRSQQAKLVFYTQLQLRADKACNRILVGENAGPTSKLAMAKKKHVLLLMALPPREDDVFTS